MSVQVSYKKQTIFFIILICITLIITEGVVRTFDIKEVHCVFIEHELFKNYDSWKKQDMCNKYNSMEYDYTQPIRLLKPDQHKKYYNVNSDGFRGSELNFQDDDYKIFLLGGSTVFGFITTSDEFTISFLLEKKIKDAGINVKVINAGIPAATSSDELYYFKNYILDYSPNMIIMYDSWNDIGQGDDFTKKQSDNSDVFINYNDEHTTEKNTKTGIITFLAKIDYKTGLGIALFLSHLIYEPEIDLSETYVMEEIDIKTLDVIESRLEKNWSEVCLLSKKHKLQTINIIHPMVGTSDRKISDETKSFMTSTNIYLKELNLDYEKLASCNNIFDFRNILAGMDNEVIYFDEGHMSDNGNEVIAENMYKKIFPIILEDHNLTKKIR